MLITISLSQQKSKKKSFRFDGIFMPNRENKLIYFVEVKFQNKHEEGVNTSEKSWFLD